MERKKNMKKTPYITQQGNRKVLMVDDAPFGFEDMGKEFTASQGFLFGMDTEDPALGTPQDVEEYGWYNRTLQSMLPLIASKYGTEDLQAVSSERKDQDTMLMFGAPQLLKIRLHAFD